MGIPTKVSKDFYPRPPRGGRRGLIALAGLAQNGFLSTPSARRATTAHQPPSVHQRYFYPRPPRGGRPLLQSKAGQCRRISIHALREEGDFNSITVEEVFEVISIHALREEGDLDR